MVDLNYNPVIEKIQKTLAKWVNRGLSIFGKVNVINTLCASLLVYKMQVLPNMPLSIVRQIENLFIEYLWGGGKPKIALHIMKGNKEDGGPGW